MGRRAGQGHRGAVLALVPLPQHVGRAPAPATSCPAAWKRPSPERPMARDSFPALCLCVAPIAIPPSRPSSLARPSFRTATQPTTPSATSRPRNPSRPGMRTGAANARHMGSPQLPAVASLVSGDRGAPYAAMEALGHTARCAARLVDRSVGPNGGATGRAGATAANGGWQRTGTRVAFPPSRRHGRRHRKGARGRACPFACQRQPHACRRGQPCCEQGPGNRHCANEPQVHWLPQRERGDPSSRVWSAAVIEASCPGL